MGRELDKKGRWRGKSGREGSKLPDVEKLEYFIPHSLFCSYNELL